VKELSETEIK